MKLRDLLSQLEDWKFLMLFRYLVDRPCQGERPSVPLDLPNSEMHLKEYEVTGSLQSRAANWLFQIAFFPHLLSRRVSGADFVKQQLSRAFVDLKRRPDVLSSLLGPGMFRVGKSRFSPIPESSSYYLITNVHHDIFRSGKEFQDLARSLFSSILEIPIHQHPTFGVGTPDTFGDSECEDFAVGLLNMPSSYNLVAREGHISVVPVTQHGTFITGVAGKFRAASTVATVAESILLESSAITGRVLLDFEVLLNDRSVKELAIQRFLEQHPELLWGLDRRYSEIRPHVGLIDAKGNRIVPDFMARIRDTDIWNIIELKLPGHPLTGRDDPKSNPSQKAAQGIAQLLRNRDFFASRANRLRVMKQFNTAPYEPCLVLVLGRGHPESMYQWTSRSDRLGLPSVKVVSYDYLFEHALNCFADLSRRKSMRSAL